VKTARPKPSNEDIHSTLREEILLLDLKPGTQLREEHLAKRFGVSRTPIRQVLARLEFERMVEQVPGTGARVSSIDTKTLRDVWAVRLKMALLVGEFVRPPAPPDVIETVNGIRRDLEQIRQSRDIRSLGALYNRFHEAMLQVIDNETLARIHDLLYIQTARVWMQFVPEMNMDVEISMITEEIDQTLEALSGDSGAWFAEIRAKHLQMVLDRFNQHVTRPVG